MGFNPNLDQRLRLAIQAFWTTRDSQAGKQGARSGVRDAGFRTAVTGGAQMNGFISVIRDLLEESGIGEAGYFHRALCGASWMVPAREEVGFPGCS